MKTDGLADIHKSGVDNRSISGVNKPPNSLNKLGVNQSEKCREALTKIIMSNAENGINPEKLEMLLLREGFNQRDIGQAIAEIDTCPEFYKFEERIYALFK